MDIIEATGSHFEIGRSIGRRCADALPGILAGFGELQEQFLPFHRSPAGQKQFETLLAINRETFPDYVAELEGVAEGSGQPLDALFLSTMRGEYRAYFKQWKAEDGRGCGSCSVVTDRVAAFGHNEDGLAVFTGTLFLLRAKPDGKPSFTVVVYPGFLPGNALGFNEHGICYAINNLKPDDVRAGVGRPFIARSLLDADSLADAVRRVTIPGRASGFNYTIGSVQERRIVNIEVAADRYFLREIEGCDFHANTYIDIVGIPHTADHSSIARVKRAGELFADGVPGTAGAIVTLLGDRGNADFPMYRYGTEKDPYRTHATALFDLDAKEFTLYDGDPRDESTERLVFPM